MPTTIKTGTFDPNRKYGYDAVPIASNYADFRRRYRDLTEAAFKTTQSALELGVSPFDPGPVFHYSPLGGAEAIIRSSSIWATDARYLNDSSELAEAGSLLREKLQGRTRPSTPPEAFAFDVLQKVANDSNFYHSSNAARVYVACFCGSGDVLSQWRGYGGDTLAYSLGFDPRSLLFLHPGRPTRPMSVLRAVGKVEYQPGNQQQLLNQFIDAMTNQLVAIHSDPVALKSVDKLVAMVRQVMTPLDVFIKNRTFEEENEYRVAFVDYGNFLPNEMRTTKYGKAQYISLSSPTPFASFEPVKVFQGPTEWPQLAAEGMREWLLRQKLATSPDVELTGSSYRR